MEETLDKVIPPHYRGWLALALAISPYLTRAYHAIVTGGGLRGMFSAIWLGTNLPKDVKTQVEETARATNTTVFKKYETKTP